LFLYILSLMLLSVCQTESNHSLTASLFLFFYCCIVASFTVMLTGTRVRMGLLEAWGLENDLRVVRREEAAAAEEAARKGAEGAARARARREGLAAGEERSRAADEKLTQVREENEG
jgi:hypothetical protein